MEPGLQLGVRESVVEQMFLFYFYWVNKFFKILLISLFCFHYSVYADNWELFPFNQSSYYSDTSTTDFNHLYHYIQDSIRDDGNSKTLFFNRFPFSLNHNQCIYESCKLIGDSTEFDSLNSNGSFYSCFVLYRSEGFQKYPCKKLCERMRCMQHNWFF